MKLEIEIERAIRKHMVENAFDPSNSIIADGQSHRFDVYTDGKFRQAEYTVILHTVDMELNHPTLICHYGFIDEKEQYTYSSLTKK